MAEQYIYQKTRETQWPIFIQAVLDKMSIEYKESVPEIFFWGGTKKKLEKSRKKKCGITSFNQEEHVHCVSNNIMEWFPQQQPKKYLTFGLHNSHRWQRRRAS